MARVGRRADPAGPAAMRRLPPALIVLPALVVVRFLPAHGAGLYLRLIAATAVVLLPGVLVARALAQRTISSALAWALAVLAAGMGVMFLVHGPLLLALGIAAALGVAALALSWRLRFPSNTLLLSDGLAPLLVLALGTALGIALWRLTGPVDGDALFHLARGSASWSRSTTWGSTPWTSSGTAACTPATPSRSGTGSSPGSPSWPASTRRSSCATKPASWRRSPHWSRTRRDGCCSTRRGPEPLPRRRRSR